MKPFNATPLDEQKHTQVIEALAAELAEAKAVDEATGDAVDKLVDGLIDMSVAKARGEFAVYRAGLPERTRRNRLPARMMALGLRLSHRLSRVEDLQAALKAARSRLEGSAEPAGQGDSLTDPAQMAGRPLSYWVHVPVLLIAAGADVAAFSQVIGLLFDQLSLPSYLLVAGLTASVLYLAHVAGAQLRMRRANARWAGLLYPIACVAVALLVGAVAFYVRLVASRPLDTNLGFTGPDAPSASSTVDTGQSVPGAVLFLALFLASVLVALSGSYLTHNPFRAAYAGAVRAHKWATFWASRILRRWVQVVEDLSQYEAARAKSRDSAEEALVQTINARLAFAAVLKERARLLIAVRMKDPVITDAYIRNTRGLPQQPDQS